MISEQYINEGIRIRKAYIRNLKNILAQEPIINEKKKFFQKIQDEMEITVKSDTNDFRKTVDLNNKLLILEKEIKSIQDIIRPFYDNIEKLKSDRDKLYLAIVEKYPNITQAQIEEEIMSKVEE